MSAPRRIALAGLHTECASTSPLAQSAADFARCEGSDLVALFETDFAAQGIEALPLVHFRAIPGGPVPRALYDAQCAEILDGIRRAMPLDGVLLAMHGAYFVPGLDDPEGDFFARIRAIIGPDALLAASYDLHGQITAQIAAKLDIFAAYRTAPHIDTGATRARAARMLARALAGGPRPQVVAAPIPLLVSGERSSTFTAPCKALYAQLPGHEGAAVWDANLMIGYLWADSPRARAAAVVTCTDRAAGRHAARAIAQSYWQARDQLAFDPPAAPIAAQLAKAQSGFTILADSGDNPTAGGVGDRADLLQAVLAAPHGTSLFAGIAAPDACAALGAGAARIEIGGAFGGGGPRVALEGFSARPVGPDWVVSAGLSTLVLTQKRRPFHHLADFDALGLAPQAHDLLVVKSGYLAPEIAALGGQHLMALSAGAVSQDYAALPNAARPRPSWPFETDFDFQADIFDADHDI